MNRPRTFAGVLALAALAAAPTAAVAQGAPAGLQPWAAQPAAQPSGTPPAPTAPPGQDAWGGMNAGGLAPPPPLTDANAGAGAAGPGTPPPSSADIRGDLDDSKDKDSGRGLSWFWVEVQGGFEHLGLQTFNVDEQALTAGLVKTSASGGVLSAGIGAQLIFLTLGVRGRMGFFDAWQVGRIGGEVGFRIPLGIVEPRFDLGAGYAALGSFDSVFPDQTSLDGFYARAGAGVDFYPVKILAIGAHASFDFMGLKRPGLSVSDIAAYQNGAGTDLTKAQEDLLKLEGSGYGAGFAIQGTAGLHF